MRKWTICALAVLALLGSVMTASAQELTEALPPEAQELLDGLEEENAGFDERRFEELRDAGVCETASSGADETCGAV